MSFRFSALLAASIAIASPALADTLQVVGAGSLTEAFNDLLRRFPAGPDTVAPPRFGPAGLMRRQIEGGAAADLFASADMEQARALVAGHPERMVINFTRNRLCAVATVAVGLTPGTMLQKMLDPSIRLATSTPGADPGGDYAFQIFARAETVQPGAQKTLEAKALKLVGGGGATPLLVPGKGPVEGVFLADKADIMLGYCSGSDDLLKAVPGLVSVPMPVDLTVGPAYGMVVLSDKNVAWRFSNFVMLEMGQAILQTHGFDPVALPAPVPAPRGLMVQRAGQPARLISPEQLAQIKPMAQDFAAMGPAASFAGPSLWDVLVQAGSVDPARPADEVRRVVRVTGADGYTVALAMAELSPDFAGHAIELATHSNGIPIHGSGLRLIVPGEKRAGRSVRDVIRLDIE